MTNLNKEGNTVELPQNETAVGVPGNEMERTNTYINNVIHVHSILKKERDKFFNTNHCTS